MAHLRLTASITSSIYIGSYKILKVCPVIGSMCSIYFVKYAFKHGTIRSDLLSSGANLTHNEYST